MSSNEVLRKMNIQTATGSGSKDSELWKARLNDEILIRECLTIRTVR